MRRSLIKRKKGPLDFAEVHEGLLIEIKEISRGSFDLYLSKKHFSELLLKDRETAKEVKRKSVVAESGKKNEVGIQICRTMKETRLCVKR